MRLFKIKVAILGATGHIGKGLIFNFKDDETIELHCYVRNIEKIQFFTKQIDYKNAILKKIEEFNEDQIDVVINCTGMADLLASNIKEQDKTIFELTEKFDNLILDYIRINPSTLYINFSSGAVYGTSFEQPVSITTKPTIEVNPILSEDYYRIAKLNSEAKHRLLNDFRIIDIRIFSYFSRFIDLKNKYLMTDILSSIKENRILKTSATNIIRDYIHPKDLSYLVKSLFEIEKGNFSCDVRSKMPISKMDILNFFNQYYDLKYEIINEYNVNSATGSKLYYYSENIKPATLNFMPEYSSIESISEETMEFFKLTS